MIRSDNDEFTEFVINYYGIDVKMLYILCESGNIKLMKKYMKKIDDYDKHKIFLMSIKLKDHKLFEELLDDFQYFNVNNINIFTLVQDGCMYKIKYFINICSLHVFGKIYNDITDEDKKILLKQKPIDMSIDNEIDFKMQFISYRLAVLYEIMINNNIPMFEKYFYLMDYNEFEIICYNMPSDIIKICILKGYKVTIDHINSAIRGNNYEVIKLLIKYYKPINIIFSSDCKYIQKKLFNASNIF